MTSQAPVPAGATGALPARTRTLGVEVDPFTLGQATELVCSWLLQGRALREPGHVQFPCRYVVTPNLDHAVQLTRDSALRSAYSDAALILSDGMPLLWASRLLARGVPERVAGSDLGPEVMKRAPAGTRVYFLGGSEEASRRAVDNSRQLFPQIELCGHLSPPPGFEHSQEWSERIVADIQGSGAELVLVGLGAPKQELWTHAHRAQLDGTVVLCIGATIDFLAGTVQRAPVWMQHAGLEWLHRLLSQPRRLASRYGKDALHFPGLLLKDALQGRPQVGKRPSQPPPATQNDPAAPES